jgi:hypothetical protein
MHKVIFCKHGVVAEFYKAIVKHYNLTIDVISYGAGLQARGYAKSYLMHKYGLSRLKNEIFKIVLCYDAVNATFYQISADDWTIIADDIMNMMSPPSSVEHIIHHATIEDWFLDDCQGLSGYFGFDVFRSTLSGRDTIVKCFREKRMTYSDSFDSIGIKLMSNLDISVISKAHENELSPLFS